MANARGLRIGLESTIIGTPGIWGFLELPRTVYGRGITEESNYLQKRGYS